ncbi:MAG: M48 family metalloprotease [Gaiellales bacterium]
MTLQQQIRANRLRTVLVLLGFGVLVALFVGVISLTFNLGVAGFVGVVAIVYGVVSWYAAGSIIAAAAGAKKVEKKDQPELYRLLENVAIAAGLPKTPDLYMIDDPAPNAFAAGRDPQHAYVAVTTGIVKLLDRRELEGVLAHEISHVRNRDVRLMSLAAVLVGVIALASDLLMRVTFWGGGDSRRDSGLGAFGIVIGLLAAILAPIGAMLLQMALSRRREYLADASAVEITGDAEGLARALAALRDDTRPLRNVTRATAHLYIESPLRDYKGLRSSLGGLFDTHPPLEERIRRLEEAGGFTLTSPAYQPGV